MKRFLLASLLISFGVYLQAQSPMRFSVHVDPQFSWFSSDEKDISNEGSVFNIHAGLQMDYFFQENYAFTVGFGINNLGGKLYYTDSIDFDSKGEILSISGDQTVKHSLQYLDFPIGLKLKTEEMGYATFFFQLGMNPMVNISAKATSDDEILYKEGITESIYTFCLGYHAEVGVEYSLGGNTALIGGVRWNSGLTDVTNNDHANIRLNTISFHLGVLF